MGDSPHNMTPEQARMARAALRLDRAAFAALGGVSAGDLALFEDQGKPLPAAKLGRLRRALASEGVALVPGGVIIR